MQEPNAEFVYPDEIEESPHSNLYREAARKFLRVMNLQADFVANSKSKDVAIWATSYALGLAICEGVSVSNRAAMLGVTPQGLSKQIKLFQNEVGLPAMGYTYKKH